MPKMFIIIELCLMKRLEKRYVTFGKCPFLCNKFRILLLIKKQWNHEAYLYRGIGSGRYMPVGFDQPVWRSIGKNDRLIRMGERHFSGFTLLTELKSQTVYDIYAMLDKKRGSDKVSVKIHTLQDVGRMDWNPTPIDMEEQLISAF